MMMAFKICPLLKMLLLGAVGFFVIPAIIANRVDSIVGSDNAATLFRAVPQASKSFDQWAKFFQSLKPEAQYGNLLPPSGRKTWTNFDIGRQTVGGSAAAAAAGQFPWQVAIYVDDRWLCGGSLILPNWILTAAHCAFNHTKFTVVFGSLNRSSVSEDGLVATFYEKYVHETYSRGLIANDIALIKMNCPIPLTKNINVIKLPPRPAVNNTFNAFNGARVIAIAYGKATDGGLSSQSLQFTNRTVIPNGKCALYYGAILVLPSTICTHQLDDESSCNGESGGPLVYEESPGQFMLIGITSFGASPCTSGPGVYSRVSSYLDWISKIVGRDTSSTLRTTPSSETVCFLTTGSNTPTAVKNT